MIDRGEVIRWRNPSPVGSSQLGGCRGECVGDRLTELMLSVGGGGRMIELGGSDG